jgi:hypothetical protein
MSKFSGSIKKTFANAQKFVKDAKYNALLHNKYLLYFVFVIALGNLFYLMMSRELLAMAVFILVGFLTSFFSKNMMVIMAVAVAITAIFKSGTTVAVEGMESKEEPVVLADKKPEVNPLTTLAKDVSLPKSDTTETKTVVGASVEGDPLAIIQEQTKQLLDTQNMLLKGIKTMAPFFKKAETMVDKFTSNSSSTK